jgi:autotransporter-associated beta strand protein
VLRSQKPQWLSDSAINVNGTVIPLSWSHPLNWLGGVPHAPGAEGHFWRTITADRAVTLDGDKTVGKLTFDSPFSYTIAPGSGGRLTFNDVSAVATLTVSQGAHAISAPVHLADNLSAAFNAGSLALSGGVSGPGGITKTGDGLLALSGPLDYSGPTTVADGTLRLSADLAMPGGKLSIAPRAVLEAGGLFARDIENDGLVRSPTFAGQLLRITGDAAGRGDYFGNVAFANRYSPGEGPASVSMTNAVLESTSTLEIELAGATPGSQHDHLLLSGRLTIGGQLAVTVIDGFVPQPGDEFNLFDWGTIAGGFDAISLPALPGAVWDVSRLYTDGILSVHAAADFNADGVVDAADLAAWTAGASATGPASRADGDADNDDDVDGADLLAWQRQLGAGATVATVPETPIAWPLAYIIVNMVVRSARPRRQSSL